MIPAFAVPLALILHGLSLWQLSRSGPPTLDLWEAKALLDELATLRRR